MSRKSGRLACPGVSLAWTLCCLGCVGCLGVLRILLRLEAELVLLRGDVRSLSQVVQLLQLQLDQVPQREAREEPDIVVEEDHDDHEEREETQPQGEKMQREGEETHEESEEHEEEVPGSCADVKTTGLPVECAAMTVGHCSKGPSAPAVRAMCPRSCKSSCDSCEDLDFTTFQEEDGSMSSCQQLRGNCQDWESGERVRRICPATCGICPGEPLSKPTAAEEAYLRLLKNRTLAIERELARLQPCEESPRESHEWRIPRVLHQTWKTDQIPAKYRAEISSWRRLHPSWRFEFWDDLRSAELMWEVFPQHAAAFEGMSGIKRADVARLAALWSYGGVYADVDVAALRPLEPLLLAAERAKLPVLLGEENVVHTVLLEKKLSGRLVSNAVMASAPRQPFWLEVLKEIFQHKCGTDPVECTGPRLLDRLSLRARGVARLPYDYFSPQLARWNAASMARGCQLYRGKLQPKHREALLAACRALEVSLGDHMALATARSFAVHRWQCSWCREDATMRTTVPLRELIFEVGNETPLQLC